MKIAVVALVAFGAGGASSRSALGGAETASAQYDNCGFHPVMFRRITQRHHISCGQAKRVLRALKAGRRSGTVPMVCGRRSRLAKGWRIKNVDREFGVVFNSYQRGRVRFDYERDDHLGKRAWCPPGGPIGGDGI